MEENMVTITEKEYLALKKDSDWLSCLEQAGVDNWSGFDYAWEIEKSLEVKNGEKNE